MPSSPEELEKQIHRLLRALPERQAPAALESRVLARLGTVPAVAPAWRAYSAWPAPLRLAFLVGSAAAAAVVIVAFSHLALYARVASAASAGGELVATTQALWADLVAAAAAVVRHIPAGWGGMLLGALAASYATLVGLGSVFYRIVIRPKSTP